MIGSTIFSDNGIFRYELTRSWADGPTWNFIMLNPSTADENQDDPTIRRCINRAKAAGAGSLIVTNLFALRATDPRMLKQCGDDPIGKHNNEHIQRVVDISDVVVCAWGNGGQLYGRSSTVMVWLRCGPLWRIGNRTNEGEPRHPLYLKESLPLVKHI